MTGALELQKIFSFLLSDERNTVYSVCKLWRRYYRWVAPQSSAMRAVAANNIRFANELIDDIDDWQRGDVVFVNDLWCLAAQTGKVANLQRIFDHHQSAREWILGNGFHFVLCNLSFPPCGGEAGTVLHMSLPVFQWFCKEAHISMGGNGKHLAFADAIAKGNMEVAQHMLPLVDACRDNIRVDIYDLFECAARVFNVEMMIFVYTNCRHLSAPHLHPLATAIDHFNGRLDARLLQHLPIDFPALCAAMAQSNTRALEMLLGDPRSDTVVADIQRTEWVGLNANCVPVLLADARIDPSMHRNFLLRTALDEGWSDIVSAILAHPRFAY